MENRKFVEVGNRKYRGENVMKVVTYPQEWVIKSHHKTFNKIL